jgi:predicted metalloprotease
LISELAGDYGRSLPAVVMAHEFGHAIQYRAGIDVSSIQLETQADCFAGAWTAWVVDGKAQHTTIRASELDDVINGFLQLRDPVGYNPGEQDAHGTYFDRVSGFADGYDGGVPACRDDFGSDRVYTEQSFSDETDYAAQGNASYDDTLTIAGQTLPTFWTSIFSSLGKQFTDPTVTAFDGDAPDCASGDPDLAYCDSDRTVYYDEKDLTQPAYSDIGDFAVVTALSLPYALAARSQLDRSTDDGDATRSAVCLTGWYEAQVFNDQFPDVVTISPGDIDEAVRFLLSYGVNDAVFPNTDASGFELLEQFRAGFLQGGSACDIGV